MVGGSYKRVLIRVVRMARMVQDRAVAQRVDKPLDGTRRVRRQTRLLWGAAEGADAMSSLGQRTPARQILAPQRFRSPQEFLNRVQTAEVWLTLAPELPKGLRRDRLWAILPARSAQMKCTLWQVEIAPVEPTTTMLATGHSRPTRAKLFRTDNPLEHIPGDDGWPIVGNTLTVLRDPVGAIEAMHARHGPVFRSRVFGFRSVSLLGPEAIELVLEPGDDLALLAAPAEARSFLTAGGAAEWLSPALSS
jgi:hypothetical protein